jgi:copper transport protein
VPNPLARALGALLCFVALVPGPATAHAVLVEARPADGERLDRPPDALELRFSEPIVPVAVRLLDASGAEVPDVAVEPRAETLVVRPRAPLPEGAYLLSYRVTSVDGHPVGATLRFGVGVEPVPEPAGAAGERAARWAGVLARWLFYATALGAVGLALFVQVVRPPEPVRSRTSRFLPWLAVAGLAAVAFRLGVAGLELAGLGPAALATMAPWKVAAGTTLGRAAAMACFGLALLILAGRGGGRLRWSGAVAVAASFALTGHAASAEPRWLAAPALAVHALAGAFWLGSLLPLLSCLRLPPEEASATLRRFSAAAAVAVGALVLAGAWLAWLQLGGRLAPLWETAYGVRLAGKLLLVAGLLALAAANRFVLTPRLALGGARRWLGRTLVADIGLGLAVLAVTATFPLGPPPRVAVAAAARDGAGAEGVTVFVAARDGQAALTLIPGRPGPNRLEAWVTDPSGAPVSAGEATVSAALPEAGLEPVRLPAAMPRPGVYAATGLPVPLAGRWRLRLDLLVDDFTKLVFEGTLTVGGDHGGGGGTAHGHRPGETK